MASLGSKLFGQLEAARLLHFIAEKVCCKLVRLVEHDKIPSGSTKLLLQLFVSGHLVKTHNKMINVFKRVSARGGRLQISGEDAEFEPELLEQLLTPLLNQAARCNDDNAPSIGTHDKLTDIKACHDGLASTGIVRKNKPQRLTG